MWKQEKTVLQGTQQIKEDLEKVKLEMETASRANDLAKMSELQYGRIPELEKKLKAAEEMSKKETHLLRTKVTEEEIAEVVSKWTHIPVSKMLEGEREKLLTMETALHKRVVGQDDRIGASQPQLEPGAVGTIRDRGHAASAPP